MKEIDIEIKNSPALSYMWHEIEQLKKQTEYGFCIKCGSIMGHVEEQRIFACTGNCGYWKNVKE